MTEAFAIPEGYYPLSNPGSSDADSNDQIETTLISGYEIVHAIQGRIRLRIMRLANDSTYAERLTNWLAAVAGVTQVNVNSLAKSVTICYQDNTPAASFIQGLLNSAQIFTEGRTAATTIESETAEPFPAFTQIITNLKPWLYRLAISLLRVAGVAFLVIGVIGILLPVLPGTPFLILASFCFLADRRR